VIFRLTRSTPLSLESLGGKACGLVRLMRAGFDVPEAWCLPATSFDPEASELTPALGAALLDFWKAIGAGEPGCAVAVRSSATVEDLDHASYAGIYRTVLGVSDADALARAVWDCWQALRSPAARAYQEQRGGGPEARMALVIQRMVSADVAGVMLTSNPLRPFAAEMAIDAAWGLGEVVASARTQPDHLVVDRTTGNVREQVVGTKEVRIDWVPGQGTEERKVGSDQRARRCLDDQQVARLAELARAMDRELGPGRDCEWAFEGSRLFVLQERPITGLPPQVPREVLSRKFGDEYLAGYTTPLAQTLLVPWIVEDYLRDMARMMGRPDLQKMEPIVRYQGYQFFSGRYMARALRALPRAARSGHAHAWFTPLWQQRMQEEPFDPWLLLRALLAPRADHRGSIRANLVALERHCAIVEARIAPKLQQDCRKLSDQEWRAQLDATRELGREHFRTIR